jgi:hypothetical protein
MRAFELNDKKKFLFFVGQLIELTLGGMNEFSVEFGSILFGLVLIQIELL